MDIKIGINNGYETNEKLKDSFDTPYVKVCFKIETPSYHRENGFATGINRDAFYTEWGNILKSFGIVAEHIGCKHKQAYLLIHPQYITGVMRKNDIEKLIEALSGATTFFIKRVNIYNPVYVITDEEYSKYLETKKADIRKLLFKLTRTTRTNKYHYTFDIAKIIARKVKLDRLGLDDGENYASGQTIDYIIECISEMIAEGFLKDCDNARGEYIRALNKTEQRAYKKSLKAEGLI